MFAFINYLDNFYGTVTQTHDRFKGADVTSAVLSENGTLNTSHWPIVLLTVSTIGLLHNRPDPNDDRSSPLCLVWVTGCSDKLAIIQVCCSDSVSHVMNDESGRRPIKPKSQRRLTDSHQQCQVARRRTGPACVPVRREVHDHDQSARHTDIHRDIETDRQTDRHGQSVATHYKAFDSFRGILSPSERRSVSQKQTTVNASTHIAPSLTQTDT